MGYARFISLAVVGSVIWVAALGILGRAVGQSWESWRHHLEYADYAAVALVVVAVVYLVIRRRRHRSVLPGADADVPPGSEAAPVDAVSR
jgi:membrane protein DedA with SNARE-associated domain